MIMILVCLNDSNLYLLRAAALQIAFFYLLIGIFSRSGIDQLQFNNVNFTTEFIRKTEKNQIKCSSRQKKYICLLCSQVRFMNMWYHHEIMIFNIAGVGTADTGYGKPLNQIPTRFSGNIRDLQKTRSDDFPDLLTFTPVPLSVQNRTSPTLCLHCPEYESNGFCWPWPLLPFFRWHHRQSAQIIKIELAERTECCQISIKVISTNKGTAVVFAEYEHVLNDMNHSILRGTLL